MDKLVLKGGKRLAGSVRISGAKNAALPVMAASILSRGRVVLRNVPHLMDVRTMAKLLRGFGATVESRDDVMTVDASGVTRHEAPYDLVRTMRASFFVLGPLLARLGRARVSLPGGCAIGTRPVDIHLKGLASLGADIEIKEGYVEARTGGLKGANVVLTYPSVGATENIMMAASLADGVTVVTNAAREPEVVDLAAFLNGMGARVTGAGTDEVRIEGVKALGALEHRLIPDRLEAGSYLLISVLTGCGISVQGARREDLGALEARLNEGGVTLAEEGGEIRAKCGGRLRSADVVTMPFPGFPTDMQAQWTALMCLAEGSCSVRETVFENRFQHVPELNRMGADITVRGNTALVRGAGFLKGAPVMVSDLRAGIALVMAGLAASGTTEVHRVYHLDRGYEGLVEKLRGVGAGIERVPSGT